MSSFPVQHSVLAEGALSGLLAAAYDLPGPIRCRYISSSMNEVYAVDAGETRYYLRVSRSDWREPHELDAEVHLVDDLRLNGLPVAGPVQRRDRHHYVTYLPAPEGTRAVVLWHAAAGSDVADLSVAQAVAFGKLAGRLHRVSDGIGPVYRRPGVALTDLVDEPMRHIRRVLDVAASRDAWRRLQVAADTVRQQITPLEDAGNTAVDRGLIHGDLHPGNVRFVGDAPTLFDFDLSGYGLRAYDLAVFRWNMALDGRGERWVASRWKGFLRGYASERAVPEALETHLHAFLIARMIWLMGLDAAGRSGFPPQWVTPRAMQQMQVHIDRWLAEMQPDAATTA